MVVVCNIHKDNINKSRIKAEYGHFHLKKHYFMFSLYNIVDFYL